MSKKRFFLFPSLSDKKIIFSTLILIFCSSLMIISAEMGRDAGGTSIITITALRQAIFMVAGILAMAFFSKIRVVSIRTELYWIFYAIILFLLLITRFFGSVNGAYAWIYIPGFNFSIQPSEFAKVFLIAFGAKLLGKDKKENNILNFKRFAYSALVYFIIIVFYQKDLGSGVVLFGICFLMCLLPPYKEFNKIHFWMIIILFAGIGLMVFLLSPLGTSVLEHFSDSYQIARFLASANPFAYQYDAGYHLIMGLSSFGTGGLFGLGYGQSIHKYMNFPNPSSDFILPVIIEEMGIVFGLIPIIVLYTIILLSLVKKSLLIDNTASKMILLGSFAYFAIHFVLNVGGVTGLIPLTGVPLLLISSGGSSLIASMMSLGISESEIVNDQKEEK